MKRLLFFSFLLVLSLSLHTNVSASHCAGGEIAYTWVSDSTYHVIFKLYRDCSGNTAPNNVPLCYKNTCTSIAYSVTLLPVATLPGGSPNGTSVSTGCGGYPNSCQSSTSTLPGYAEWWYEGDITLPGRCNQWEFSASISARNQSTNLTGGTGNIFYVEATLNNLVAQGNSSPVFTVKPVPFVCINSPYTYNNGASDPDGDSLSYSIIAPEKGDCNGVLPIPFSSPIYNTTNNPISTGNTFIIDPVTGQMSFSPTLLGASTITLKVSEYRNNVLIGSTMRDIQVRTLTCNSVQPSIAIDTFSLSGTTLTNGRIQSCANKPLSFCFKVRSTNNFAILVASDNHASVTPGATMTYTGQGTDSILGCFSWIPTPADTGFRIFTITVKDSTCLPPGIAVSQSFALPIYIYSVTNIFKDTTVCAGTPVPLQASGGSVFTWSVLPGGSSLSTLSCTVCSNPVATPLVTTRYVVTSNLISVCNKNIDTVTITVIPQPALPPTYSNSPVCKGASLQLYAGLTATTYQWTGPAGFNSTLQNPVIANAQIPNSGTYQLIVKNGQCTSPPATITVVVNPAPGTPVLTGNSPVCEGRTIKMHASGGGVSAVYNWAGPNSFSAVTTDISVNADAQHAGVYTVYASYPGNACNSQSSTYTVTLNPNVVADFQLSRNTICEDDTLAVNYTGTGAIVDSLRWDFSDGIIESGANSGPYVIRFPKNGVRTITLNAANVGCTDSISKSVNVVALPSSNFSLQRDACLGQTIKVEATALVGYGLQFTWDFAGATIKDGADRGPYHISFNTPGYKIVTLTTKGALCQSLVSSDTVYVHPQPVAQILSASKTDVCTSDTIQLAAFVEQDHSYHWSPESFFSNVNSPTPNARIYYTGYIFLQAVDSFGCSSTDSMFINTTPCCEVYLPNAFTPNGDGRNDRFRVITVGHHSLSNFRVVNRWGQTVFETTDESRGWDGTYDGKPMDPGSYFYYLKYKCSNGQFYEQKGDVLLIR